MTTPSGSGRPAGDPGSSGQSRPQDWKGDSASDAQLSPAAARRRNLLVAGTGTVLALAVLAYFVIQSLNKPPATHLALIGIADYSKDGVPSIASTEPDEIELRKLNQSSWVGRASWTVDQKATDRYLSAERFNKGTKDLIDACQVDNLVMYCSLHGLVTVDKNDKAAAALMLQDGTTVLVRDLIQQVHAASDSNKSLKNVLVILNVQGLKPNWAIGVLADDFESTLETELAEAIPGGSKIVALHVKESSDDESAEDPSTFAIAFRDACSKSDAKEISLSEIADGLSGKGFTLEWSPNFDQKKNVKFAIAKANEGAAETRENKKGSAGPGNAATGQQPEARPFNPRVIPTSLAFVTNEEFAKEKQLAGASKIIDKLLQQTKAAQTAAQAAAPTAATPAAVATPAPATPDELEAWLSVDPKLQEKEVEAAKAALPVKWLQLALVLHQKAQQSSGDRATLHALQQLVEQADAKLRALVQLDLVDKGAGVPEELQLIERLGTAAGKMQDAQWPAQQSGQLIKALDTFEAADANAGRIHTSLDKLNPASVKVFYTQLLAAEEWIEEPQIPLERRTIGANECLAKSETALKQLNEVVADKTAEGELRPILVGEVPGYGVRIASEMDQKSDRELISTVKAEWTGATSNAEQQKGDKDVRVKIRNARAAIATSAPNNKLLKFATEFDSRKLVDAKTTWQSDEKREAASKASDTSGIWQAFWAIQVLSLDSTVKDETLSGLITDWCNWAPDADVFKRIELGKKIELAWKDSVFNPSKTSTNETQTESSSSPSNANHSSIGVIASESDSQLDDKNRCEMTVQISVPPDADSAKRRLEVTPVPASVAIDGGAELKPDDHGGFDISTVRGKCKLSLTWATEPDLAQPLQLVLLESSKAEPDAAPLIPVAVHNTAVKGYVNPNHWKITFKDAADQVVFEASPSSAKDSAPPVLSIHTFAEGRVLRPFLTRPKNESSTSISVTASAPEENDKLNFEELKEARLAKGGIEMPLVLKAPLVKDHLLPNELVFVVQPNQPENAKSISIRVPVEADTEVGKLIDEVAGGQPTYTAPGMGEEAGAITVRIRRGAPDAFAKLGLPAETKIPVTLEVAGFPALVASVEDVPPDTDLPISLQLDPSQIEALQKQSRDLDVWLSVAGVPHAFRWHGNLTDGFGADFLEERTICIASPRHGEVRVAEAKSKSAATKPDATKPEGNPSSAWLAVDKQQLERQDSRPQLDVEAALFRGHVKTEIERGGSAIKPLRKSKFRGVPYLQKVAVTAAADGGWALAARVEDFKVPENLNPGKYTLVARLVGPDGAPTSGKGEVDIVEFAVDGSAPAITGIAATYDPKEKSLSERKTLPPETFWSDLPLDITWQARDPETDTVETWAMLADARPNPMEVPDVSMMQKGSVDVVVPTKWTTKINGDALVPRKGKFYIVVVAKNKSGMIDVDSKAITLTPPLATLRVNILDKVRYVALRGEKIRPQEKGTLDKLNLGVVASPQVFRNLDPGKYTFIAARNDNGLFLEKYSFEVKEGEPLEPLNIVKLQPGEPKDLIDAPNAGATPPPPQ